MAKVARDYQKAALDGGDHRGRGCFKEWEEHQSTLVCIPTGGGKTKIAADVINRFENRAFFAVHLRKIVRQSARELRKMCPGRTVAVEMANSRSSSLYPEAIVCGSIPTLNTPGRLNHHNPFDYDILILDECFVSGTLVDGVPIEKIQRGQLIDSFNHIANKKERRRVKSVFCSKPTAILTVHLSTGGKITCTKNHPFYTQRGYVAADSLLRGEILFDTTELAKHGKNKVSLRQRIRGRVKWKRPEDWKTGIQSSELLSWLLYNACRNNNNASLQTVRQDRDVAFYKGRASVHSEDGVLQQCVQGCVCEEGCKRKYGCDESSLCLRTDEKEQSDEASRVCRQDGQVANWTNVFSAWWKRAINRSTKNAFSGTGRASYGVSHSDSPREKPVPVASELLQSGYSESRNNVGDRSGRQQSQSEEVALLRQAQREGVESIRVERVEIHEPTSDGTFGGVCPDGFVYNLEVEDNHNYFVNGVLVHNCHHALGESWIKVINHFKQNPNLKILFLSATPERHDGKPLRLVCESVAYHYTLKEAIADGYLVRPLQQFAVIPGLDYSQVKKVAGDLNKKEVSLAWEDVKVLHHSVQCSVEAMFGLYPRELSSVPEEQWSDYIGDRPCKTTLGFTVNVKHAEFVANALNRIRPGLAEWIHGKMDYDEVQRKFLAFENGRCPSLFSYGMTIEGFDAPLIELILDMQPTLSLSRLTQKIGRGTRTLPGTIDGLNTAEERKAAIKASKKPVLTVINFAGKQGKHKIVSSLDLLGGIMTPQVKARVEEEAREKAVDVEEAVEDAREQERQREIEALAAKTVKTNYALDSVDIFTGKKKKTKLSRLEKAARAEQRAKQPLSAKQWDLLKKQKLNPESRTEAQNKELLKQIAHRRLAGLVSFAQAFVLQRYGYSKDQLRTMRRHEGTRLIDAIAANGWRKPASLSTAQEPKKDTFEPAF